MDSFSTIFFTSSAGPSAEIPTNTEGDSGQTSGGYCVVFAKDIPQDKEGDSGQTSGGYCVVA